jgi:hypothetical protein
MPWILLPLYDDDRPRAQSKERSLFGWPLGYDKARRARSGAFLLELELELIQTHMAQKPMLRVEVYLRL